MIQYKLASVLFAIFLNFAAAGSIERPELDNYIITCNTGERLEDAKSFPGYDYYTDTLRFSIKKFYINNCTPPKDNYQEAITNFNISVSRYDMDITINGMPRPYDDLTDEMVKNVVSLRINISNVEYLHKVEWETGVSLSDLEEIIMTCQGDTLEEKPRFFFNRTLKMTTNGRMVINSCPSPKKSYADVIRRLNLSPDTVKDLVLTVLPKTSIKTSDFQELAIRKLTLIGAGTHRLKYYFLEPLNSLSLDEITIRNMELPPFPNETNIQTVSLTNGESLAEFGGCSRLKKLHLEDWDVPNLNSWLGHCANLRELNLNILSKFTITRVLNNLTMITSLNITNSYIRQLDGSVLADVVNLRKLSLQNNSFWKIKSGAFKSQSKLEELDLSWNSLTEWNFAEHLHLLSLKKLNLDRNHVSPFCLDSLYSGKTPPLPIEHISARHSQLDTFCFYYRTFGQDQLYRTGMENLTYVDLSYNNVGHLFSFDYRILIPRKRDLIVDIRGNNELQGFDFDKSSDYDYFVKHLKTTHNLTINTDMRPLDCDCNYGWLGKALRELPHVRIEGATCAKDAFGPSQPISEKEPKHQECYKFTYNNCTFRMDFYTLQIRADCRKAGLTEMINERQWTFVKRQFAVDAENFSIFMNLTEISVSENGIKIIKTKDIPETLKYLDLQNNDIDRLNEAVLSKMFELPSRRVRLSGNPIICDCENSPMLASLKEHRDQIEDYSALRCVGTGKLVSELNLDDLCAEERERLILIAAVSGATFLALLVAATALYYRYRQYVKIYLYARGLCLCCVREEEADASRPFDAFVSFAHGDEGLVEGQLLPHLEHDYRLCVHTRTWVLGEMIHTQILRSVAQSRRTVIILSRNFVKSVWGMVEFKTAYMSALREGRVRLIVVIVDDVIDDEDLDPELEGYLKTYTYIRLDDPWFLKKLRYALPHRSTKLIGRVDKSECKSEHESEMLKPDVPPMITVSNGAYSVDLNSGEEEFEMRTN